ncbi:serpin B [Pricia antarctica]|uniref:Serpin B n=1 Tax=Pricia antarctica TaxID=641691 RepID=A0A1G7EMQ2_9FLAO|nr:serpin family protein [Pricia antarctica]SDE64968.1 serpin B [Pricia antarctica]
MKFIKAYFAILLVLVGCTTSDDGPSDKDLGLDRALETTEAKTMVATNNEFALDFFKEIATTEAAENYMVSPLSLSLALGMTYNGADGDTKAAFGDVLGYADVDAANSFNKKLIKSLTASGSGAVLNLAQAIWIKDDFPVEADFVTTNQNFYDAEVGNLDFEDPKAVDVVNSWAYDHTKGKIDKYIDSFEPNTVLFLANALYFKGTWKFEFDPSDTRQAAFHASLSETVQVPMMFMNATVPYFTNEMFSSIILPYKNDRYEMLLFLPHEGFSTTDIVSELNMENLKNWLDSYSKSGLAIQLPKFKLEYKRELNEELTNMGLGVAFSNTADFGKINKQAALRISKVLQKTFIEVNEEGTEAAAVTSVEIGLTSTGATFIADHPFLYMIRDSYTGSICIMGRIGKP